MTPAVAIARSAGGAGSAAPAVDLVHLLPLGCRIDGQARQLALLIDPEFLAEAGWNPAAPGVAEVEVASTGEIKLRRVTVALDCGPVVNPNTVISQVQGGLVFGLTAALRQKITIKDGAVEQRSFSACPILTMAEMPDIEVHVISDLAYLDDFAGLGEPGVPGVAPALTNAIFAASKQRVRTLPIG